MNELRHVREIKPYIIQRRREWRDLNDPGGIPNVPEEVPEAQPTVKGEVKTPDANSHVL